MPIVNGVPDYNSSFVYASTTYKFDVVNEGYSVRIEDDGTVKRIPFSQQNSVVIQRSGTINPVREYRVLFYTALEFEVFADLVGATGVLAVGGQQAVQGAGQPQLRFTGNAYFSGIQLTALRNEGTALCTLTFTVVP